MLKYKVTTPPASEPVTLAEAKAHLRVSIDDDDDLISELIATARELCELWTSRAFLTTTFRLTLNRFPGQLFDPWGVFRNTEREPYGVLFPIPIPVADLISVTSLSYVDVNGSTVVLDPSLYQVETGAPGRVYPAYGRTWPASRIQAEAITIVFVAGFTADPAQLPKRVKAAIKLLVSHLYENREATTVVKLEETPFALQSMVALLDWGFRP